MSKNNKDTAKADLKDKEVQERSQQPEESESKGDTQASKPQGNVQASKPQDSTQSKSSKQEDRGDAKGGHSQETGLKSGLKQESKPVDQSLESKTQSPKKPEVKQESKLEAKDQKPSLKETMHSKKPEVKQDQAPNNKKEQEVTKPKPLESKQDQAPNNKKEQEVTKPKPLESKQDQAPTEKPEAKQEIKKDEASTSPKKPEAKKGVQQSAPHQEAQPKKVSKEGLKLEGLFAFKLEMTSLYDENGKHIPVTALRYEPLRVSQVKKEEPSKLGYEALQLAGFPQKNNRNSKPLIKHLKKAKFQEGARYIQEVRQKIPEGVQVGDQVSIESFKKGDVVRISSLSKGRGFSGVMKRWGFHGGRASHGAKTHRAPGSIGQNTEPSRVMPGRKMPGQYGFKRVTKTNVPIVEVFPEENILFVKGPVPGARNTLVSLQKVVR